MVRLTDSEKAMLDGKEGPGRQKAMELLVRYAEALGAERFVDTDNVCGYVVSTRGYRSDIGDLDAIFSNFSLDSEETVKIPPVKCFSSQNQLAWDPEHIQELGLSREIYDFHRENERFISRLGVQLLCTCAPYLAGNLPIKGEHCAWMESSAIAFINAVIGARTNVEGSQSAAASMLTGKTPYWGLHLDENRAGSHLVRVECDVNTMTDWGLLGYYAGRMVGSGIPVFDGLRSRPDADKLKHLSAAAASSGGVEMYHIPGVTPEASSVSDAFRGRKPADTFVFGEREKLQAYQRLNQSGRDRHVDLVVIGCPHASIKQIWQVASLLEGKRIASGTAFWVFTARSMKAVADRNGYSKIISDAGGVIMCDGCPAMGLLVPKGTRVVATDSAKQAHYLPQMLNIEGWFGSLEDCVNAAITGQWGGELR